MRSVFRVVKLVLKRTSVISKSCTRKADVQTTRTKISCLRGLWNHFGNRSLTVVIKHSTSTNWWGSRRTFGHSWHSKHILSAQWGVWLLLLHVSQQPAEKALRRNKQSKSGAPASELWPEGKRWRPDLDLRKAFRLFNWINNKDLGRCIW